MTEILCEIEVKSNTYKWAESIKFYTPTPPMFGDSITLSYRDTSGTGELLTQKFLIVERSWVVEADCVVGIILVCEPIEEL